MNFKLSDNTRKILLSNQSKLKSLSSFIYPSLIQKVITQNDELMSLKFILLSFSLR
jgi:hypothetical protein